MAMLIPPPQQQTPPTLPPNFFIPPNYYAPPATTVTPSVNYSTAAVGCCDTTWLYMLVAGLIGGIIGYAIHTQRKVK